MENKNMSSLEEKTVHLQIWGSEREFVLLDENGNIIDYWMSALIPSDLCFYVDDDEVACDPDLQVNVGEPRVVNLINNVDQVISGIREYSNKSGYACDIQVKGEFDINKVILNVTDLIIKIGDDEYSDGPFLDSILYDGKEYSDFDVDASSGIGSEIVWGKVEVEEEEFEDGEFEEAEDPIGECEYGNVTYHIFTDCAFAQFLVGDGASEKLVIPDVVTFEGKEYPVTYWGAGNDGVKVLELGKNVKWVDALHAGCGCLEKLIIHSNKGFIEWENEDGDSVSSAEECFPGVEITYVTAPSIK